MADETITATNEPVEVIENKPEETKPAEIAAAETKPEESATTEIKPTETTETAANDDKPTAAASATTTDAPAETVETLKRKADDRDWRERRDEDNKRGRTNTTNNNNHGSHRPTRQDYNANVKSDFSTLPESSDPEEIRKQVEFYFSDSNLLTDKFLLSKVGGSTNNPVPLKVIHSFKRMRRFQPYSAVLAALKESTFLSVTDDEQLQRRTPLPSATTEDPSDNITLYDDVTRSRSIYAKGFGAEEPSTQVDIEAFFAPYGPINAIRLRRSHPEKIFKRSVFVEFDSDETAKAFLELESKPKWKGDVELLILSKEDYVRGKAEDVKAGRIKGSRGRGGARGRGGRGGNRDGDERSERRERRDGDRGGRGGRGGRGRGDRGGRGGRGGKGGRDRNEERRQAEQGQDSAAPAAAPATEAKPER